MMAARASACSAARSPLCKAPATVAGLAAGRGGFTGEEQRAAQRRRQAFARVAAAHGHVAICAAREWVGLPIVNVGGSQSLGDRRARAEHRAQASERRTHDRGFAEAGEPRGVRARGTMP